MGHFVSAACKGEGCAICARTGIKVGATHKVGEEIPHDDPTPERHNLTAYVCCNCFMLLFGPVADCRDKLWGNPADRMTDRERALAQKFKDAHYHDQGVHAQVSLEFDGTGIGTLIHAVCSGCGARQNITDYDAW
jgi:hypothetical protein